MIYWPHESVASPRTRPLTAAKLSSSRPLLHLCSRHSCLFVLCSLTSCPVFLTASQNSPPLPPPPTLRFCPQRWRADSYNYPSACEMNHWVADWAAWWETSILSGTTECARASPSSLRWCPGLASTCWGRESVVCSLRLPGQTPHPWPRHMCSSKTPVQNCAGTKKRDDATLLVETQPDALLCLYTVIDHSRKTTSCVRVTLVSYSLYRHICRGVGRKYSWLDQSSESHLLMFVFFVRYCSL